MGFFGNLFKKKPVIEADDSVFGRISYDMGIWVFIPDATTGGFMITVDAPESGPTPIQREFFLKLRSRLSEFEDRARMYMRSHVEEAVDVACLTVYSVEIGSETECQREEFVLEMCDANAFDIHRVSFEGANPVDYGCDD